MMEVMGKTAMKVVSKVLNNVLRIDSTELAVFALRLVLDIRG